MERSYNQFCPVAMAAEVLCSRWTVVLLRELLAGSTRFNDLRRGLPRMSPALLSQRLKELEETGVVERRPVPGEPAIHEYALTDAGRELQPLVESFGKWGQRWIPSKLSLEQLDANLLMWDMRRGLKFEPPPSRRLVIQFQYPDAPRRERSWWLIVEPGHPVDLCSVACGRVDAYYEKGLAPWDLAAGGLIAAEAGAVVTAFDGGPLGDGTVVAAAPGIAAELRALVVGAGAVDA